MPDRVLPSLFVLAVIREPIHDELVDAVQGDLLLRSCTLDGHGDQRDVRVGRLDHILDADHSAVRGSAVRSRSTGRSSVHVGRTGVRIVTAHSCCVVVAVTAGGYVTGGSGGGGRCSRCRRRNRSSILIGS